MVDQLVGWWIVVNQTFGQMVGLLIVVDQLVGHIIGQIGLTLHVTARKGSVG